MTDLTFRNSLVDNTFAYTNVYDYTHKAKSGLYFSKEGNYPYILQSGHGDDVELMYSPYPYQLRNRNLTAKKAKEVMNSAHLPIRVFIQKRIYFVGKGFLAKYDNDNIGELLFIACAKPGVTEMKDVKFFISRKLYTEEYKVFQGVLKEILSVHTGDVTICNNLLDYMVEKLNIPKGGTIGGRKKYIDALIRATAEEVFKKERLEVLPSEGTIEQDVYPSEEYDDADEGF